mgnify:CR=1 FL=1
MVRGQLDSLDAAATLARAESVLHQRRAAEVEDLRANWAKDKEWKPSLDEKVREKEYRLWKKAVTRTFDWVEAEERVPVPA